MVEKILVEGMDRTWWHSVRLEGVRILVAEDDPISRAILKNFLMKKRLVTVFAENGAKALRIISEEPESFSVILADWMMPEMDGITLIRKVREIPDMPYIYMILLTSKDAKQDIVAGFMAGADDYVTKPYDMSELWARIMTGIRVRSLMDQLADRNKTLADLALKDALTGLLNRRAMESMLKTEIARSIRKKKSLGVCMTDIDHFKRVNDTYGHGAGDLVLKQLAGLLDRSVRMMDTVTRVGGEEFLMIFPETDSSGCRIIGERLRLAVAQYPFKIENGTVLNITVSLGFAVNVPVSSENEIQRFLKKADEALYYSKRTGRNRCTVYSLEDESM